MCSSITDKTKNRGFAFVEYVNHRAASKARRKLVPDRVLLWGQEIAVDWADPEPEIDDDVMSKVGQVFCECFFFFFIIGMVYYVSCMYFIVLFSVYVFVIVLHVCVYFYLSFALLR